MIGKITTLLLKIVTLPFWYIQRLFPRDKKIWLFGAGSGMLYFDNAKWLYEFTLRNEKPINAIWITRSKEIYNKLTNENKPVLMTNSLKGILTSLRAGVVFINNTPKDVNSRAINGSLQIWLWHGLMMKQIGEDARLFSREKNGKMTKALQFIQETIYPELSYRPDYVINTSDFFTPFFSSAFNLPREKILLTGYPRNDALFSDGQDQLIEEINKKFNNPRIIIYLPTWRDSHFNIGKSFNPFNSYGFDITVFLGILEDTNSVFLNKGHNYESKDVNITGLSDRFINLNRCKYSDLYKLIKDVDLLITDYSSVYFDFILTGKPVVLAPFDFHSYTTESRPLYYDYFEEIEGVKASDWIELFEILKSNSYYNTSSQTIKKYHLYLDNLSSDRVIETTKNLIELNDRNQ